jgi:hypothetical protein
MICPRPTLQGRVYRGRGPLGRVGARWDGGARTTQQATIRADFRATNNTLGEPL